MKKNKTEVVFILDKSGSMSGLEADTIGGFNSMLKKQKKERGEAIVTTVIFDDNYELLHDRINIKDIPPITEKEYFVGGCTALLDAIGKTINKIVNVQRNTSINEKSDNVIFIITTDGMENSSEEYSYEKIKKLIKCQKEEFGWEFIFLGANIDAIATAARFGISKDRASNYHADSKGTRLNYEAVSSVISEYRVNKSISQEWKKDIKEDYEGRGN